MRNFHKCVNNRFCLFQAIISGIQQFIFHKAQDTALGIVITREAPNFEKTLHLQEASDFIFNITDSYSHYWGQISFQNPQQFIIFKEYTLLSETKIKHKLLKLLTHSSFFCLWILYVWKTSHSLSAVFPQLLTNGQKQILQFGRMRRKWETHMWNILRRLLQYFGSAQQTNLSLQNCILEPAQFHLKLGVQDPCS